MDTSWWPALAAVVLLALVATLVDGWGRRGRRPAGRARRTARPARPQEPDGTPVRAGERPRPRPAEIWWARVPHDDGPDGPAEPDGPDAPGGPEAGDRLCDRPCLVLSVRGDRARVARITMKFREERAGVIPLPPGSVGDARGRTSFLETDEPRDVPVRDLRRRVGVADPLVWDQVRHLAG
ncbi:type II toxin-antitoxin system PemK/MazF family toxin [Streptomyces poonensis]|nr:type II toxin-antitoxin system PemK/MazF family toxin [Streptomyces poonensis]